MPDSIEKYTGIELFNLLENNQSEFIDGQITLNLGGISVQIDTTDTVGNSLQSWLKKWMESKRIYYREAESTQVFPDFFLGEENDKNLLEVKAFNYKASPAFDVANFESYCESLTTKAYRLDADYLIFGYTMDNANISIRRIWLKKIWEITSTSSNHALRVQDKRGMIYNIRPTKWYSQRATSPFARKEDFVLAIYETLSNYEHTQIDADTWLNSVIENYQAHTGNSLDINLV